MSSELARQLLLMLPALHRDDPERIPFLGWNGDVNIDNEGFITDGHSMLLDKYRKDIPLRFNEEMGIGTFRGAIGVWHRGLLAHIPVRLGTVVNKPEGMPPGHVLPYAMLIDELGERYWFNALKLHLILDVTGADTIKVGGHGKPAAFFLNGEPQAILMPVKYGKAAELPGLKVDEKEKVDITVTISGAPGVGKSALLELIRMCLKPHIDCMIEEQTPYIEVAMEIIDREQPVVLLRSTNA